MRFSQACVWVCLLGAVLGAGDRPKNGDVNFDGSINIVDAVYLLRYMFMDGPAPLEGDPCPPCDSCCPDTGFPVSVLSTGDPLCVDPETFYFADRCPGPGERGFGQDGWYHRGVSHHLEVVTFDSPDTKDWITVDYATGLMWQYEFPSIDGLIGVSMFDAVKYALNLRLGGFDDWRIPNLFEVMSLFVISRYDYCVPRRPLWEPPILYKLYPFPEGKFSGGSQARIWTSTGGGEIFFSANEGRSFLIGLLPSHMTATFRCVRTIKPGDLPSIGMPEPGDFVPDPPISNGDINGDGRINMADVVVLLRYLFKLEYAPGLDSWVPVSNRCPGCDWCCPDFPARLPATDLRLCEEDSVFWTCNPRNRMDATVHAGVPRHFKLYRRGRSDSSEWITVDLTTGLMWQYEHRYFPEEGAFWEAMAYCESLECAGFDDWRMPTLPELLTLWTGNHVREYIGYLDARYFKTPWGDDDDISREERWEGVFMTSTFRPRASSRFHNGWDDPGIVPAYTVDFFDGTSGLVTSGPGFSVRAVRSVKPGDLERLEEEEAGRGVGEAHQFPERHE